ncbi:hypothetical protein [Bradyrhizobium elkanii]|uniref:hypothetical protein n=1 Tax=Bradyrhizobium elkanii TaxID=29448 RepID=UPI0004BCAFB7|nr:hypothetical protein [Bradyrhizobium elkanii]MCP1927416.1 hypothetical protein [Bradyrhizobium elkanii]MCS3475068.1 hypothetical protein [Bradyrhizobium elkanii]MCS3521075.1 hypothetical protein [Bradyrhizobium elkanii]MCS4068730.1 hypothetical protein [Bradyrhizobium elkanii]MCS4084264.1 hypothetical protein [Bradyrhizobium elkanii]
MHDEKLAGLHAKSSQLLLFDWAIEHYGLCAAFRDGHPHHFRRIGDGHHLSYVPEFFVVVAIFLADSRCHYPTIHLVELRGL